MADLSRCLSYILRHGAERKGFEILPGGFLYVDDLLKMNELQEFSEADFENVVKNNDKQRFALEREHTGRLKIRANQGHSINVEGLDLKEITDLRDIPVVLHGTFLNCWESIKEEGLKRMERNHIHFAPGESGDGVISGMRSTCEIIITINAEKAMTDGIKFYQSTNKVILSPGDENGCIHPRYFKLAEKLQPERIPLELDSAKSKHPLTSDLKDECMSDSTSRQKNSNKKTALILGHSFVKRLKKWMRVNGKVMAKPGLDVYLHGVGGRTISQVYYNDMHVVRRYNPDIIFLQIGGNDISVLSSPTDVFVKMRRLITVLREECSNSTIIIGTIFSRNRPRDLSARAFRTKKQKINKFLYKEFGNYEFGKKVFLFKHKFFIEEYFDEDLVHLNSDGNQCFLNSILSAVDLAL